MGNNNVKVYNNDKLKIITYNVRLLYNSPLRCDKIGHYLNNEFDNHPIICLQGLYNHQSKKRIYQDISKKYDITKVIPSIFNDKVDDDIGIVILSVFDIIDYYSCIFPNNNPFIRSLDDKKRGMIYANILVNDTVVSVYNACLQSDIKSMIDCSSIRKIQLDTIISKVKDNIDNLKGMEDKHKYNFGNIHLIIGNLNINEYDEHNDRETKEYIGLVNNNNFLDLIRIIDKDTHFHTYTDEGKRLDYIMLFLEDKFDSIDNIKRYLLDTYDIKLVHYNIREKLKYSDHVPCELVLEMTSE